MTLSLKSIPLTFLSETELHCQGNQCSRCGNGIRELAESCDDGNNADLDGCGAECVLEAFFDCENELGEMTRCRHYEVDMNRKDNSTLDHFIWYSKESDYVFLADPELTNTGRLGNEVLTIF